MKAFGRIGAWSIPEAVRAKAGASGITMCFSSELVQVASQLSAQNQGSDSSSKVQEALVGCKVPLSKQLACAARHEGPVGAKNQAG